MIPHNKPTINKEEIQSVISVLKNGLLVQGKKIKEFEDNFCRFIGLPDRFAAAACNGTAALYMSLKVLGVCRGDRVIIPTYVCTSLLNAVYLVGAEPIITDVNLQDFNISLNFIKEKKDSNTKAIIVPHMFGTPADIKIMQAEFSIPIIEDCATAIGSYIDDKHVGTLTEIAIFSFYASKMIATGQGGMVVSKNNNLVDEARDFIDFDLGKGKEKGKRKYYPRFNFEMTDMQAVLGITQLCKLDSFLEKRKQIAKAYKEICSLKGWDYQKPVKDIFHSNWYRFVIKNDTKKIQSLQKYLKKNGISTIIPIENWELLHNFLGLNKSNFSNAERISRETLSLPIYPSLIDEGNLEKVIKILKKY